MNYNTIFNAVNANEMNEKLKKLNAYFDTEISKCHDDIKLLSAESREDEANFEKIKCNVYEIFKTVLGVAAKNEGAEPDKVKGFFLSRLEKIPSNWQAAYELAQKHNDEIAMHRESLKLETAKKIRNEFCTVWGEER